MSIVQILILAIVQGLAELLPVSSSAHVVVAEKLLGLDPASPRMTLLLVMLHSGTMFAVIAYFWKSWKKAYFASRDCFYSFAIPAALATFLTGLVGYPLIKFMERTLFHGLPEAEIENLFGRLDLVGAALFAVGVLIVIAGWRERGVGRSQEEAPGKGTDVLSLKQAGFIGAAQGFCLPFRGFSRSGATISVGLLAAASRETAERFSFALAVILTPPIVVRETLRLLHTSRASNLAGVVIDLRADLGFAALGALFSFSAGLVALKWLSKWLETGKWYLFGIYCLVASGVVFYLHSRGI